MIPGLSIGTILAIEEAFAQRALDNYISELKIYEHSKELLAGALSERREKTVPILHTPTMETPFVKVRNRFEMMNGKYSAGTVAIIPVSGVMRVDGGPSSFGISDTTEWLLAANSNPTIDGVVLEINSGGGEAYAGQMLRSAVDQMTKPVVSFVHFGASAAYLVAAGTNEIWASGAFAQVGSIGAMMVFSKQALAQVSEDAVFLIGKDSPNKNRDLLAAVQGDFSGMQETVDKMTAQFQKNVVKSRNLDTSIPEVAESVKGGMYFAAQAKSLGLLDGIGTLQTAMNRVNKLKRKY